MRGTKSKQERAAYARAATRALREHVAPNLARVSLAAMRVHERSKRYFVSRKHACWCVCAYEE
eukprot:5840739-Pleurochrysis_carterae.AAC.1